MCCLRYEDKTYTELKKLLPHRNTRVKTRLGEGKVVDYQILTQLVAVELDNGTKVVVPREEIEIITQSKQKNVKDKPAEKGDTENTNGDELQDDE